MTEKLKAPDNEQRIKDTFRQTYFISQGNMALQALLFDWISIQKIISREELKSVDIKWLTDFSSPKLHDPSGYKGEDNQKDDPKNQWSNLRSSLIYNDINGDQDAKPIVYKIFAHLLLLDLEYQILKRPNRPETKAEPDSKQDPHKSFLRRYVILGNYSVEPFSELFADLKKMELKNLIIEGFDLENIEIPEPKEDERDRDRKKIGDWVKGLGMDTRTTLLMKLWEKNHPGERFFS